ncbi:hypothetical protein QBC99_000887 [Beijerinckia sp. GAS462]|uniref:hypothetical protein n=1 Tax=Beijerinckia sp. GAS462 TaxID=3039852 RepID=UPI00247A3C0A|nr:hypothetical protein [Beijerinckia sp. GAS462]MDH7794824.1 hypothetical protein [Beijerinckia sp. GAS462]
MFGRSLLIPAELRRLSKRCVVSRTMGRKTMIVRTALLSGFVAGLLLASLPAAVAADRNVDIVNNTKKTLKEFYASRTNKNAWEENIIGDDPVKPGETQPVDIDDGSGGCRFDFKAIFSDGDEVINKNVDVCAVSTMTYK